MEPEVSLRLIPAAWLSLVFPSNLSDASATDKPVDPALLPPDGVPVTIGNGSFMELWKPCDEEPIFGMLSASCFLLILSGVANVSGILPVLGTLRDTASFDWEKLDEADGEKRSAMPLRRTGAMSEYMADREIVAVSVTIGIKGSVRSPER